MPASSDSSVGVAHGAAPTDGRTPGRERSCPSAPCREGALLIGVMTQRGTLAYVQPPTRVDADFVEKAKALGRPESRFRFSSPCIESGCPQWTGDGCAVVEEVLEAESANAPSSAALPQCAIRSTCRWFFQRGAAACAVCPLVVADIGGAETYKSLSAQNAT